MLIHKNENFIQTIRLLGGNEQWYVVYPEKGSNATPESTCTKKFQVKWDDNKVDEKKKTEGKVDSIKYSQSFKLDPFSAYI